jgi:polyphosphate kinase 2 (PPK2 family)
MKTTDFVVATRPNLREIDDFPIIDFSDYERRLADLQAGRVLVERVEGFATEDEWHRAYEEINEFERMLAADGVRLVKLFLHITRDEQLRRSHNRIP